MPDTILRKQLIKSIAANDAGFFALTGDNDIYFMSNTNVWLKLPEMPRVEVRRDPFYDGSPHSSDTLENR